MKPEKIVVLHWRYYIWDSIKTWWYNLFRKSKIMSQREIDTMLSSEDECEGVEFKRRPGKSIYSQMKDEEIK
jgi:hypothetical protein